MIRKVLLLVAVIFSLPDWYHGRPIDPVIIFAGQSQFISPNIGCSALSAYSYLQPAISNVKISDMSGALTTFQACVNSNPALGGGTSTAWGTEAQFAYRWSQDNPNRTLYIIKNAIGSTPLYNTGNGDGTCIYATTPNANWSPSSTGNCFSVTTTLVSTVLSGLRLAGKNPQVVAIMWYQGGTDAQNLTYANAYAVNLPNFISSAQSQWAGYAAPVFVARFSSQTTATYSATIRSAQNAVASLNSPVIDTDTFALQGDNVHPSALGNVQLGDAFYNDFVNPIPGP